MRRRATRKSAICGKQARALGYVLTRELPRRVREIAARDLKTDQLMRGFLFGLDEDRAHRFLTRRLLYYDATPEDAASAVYHADSQHRLERAMDLAAGVAAESRDAT